MWCFFLWGGNFIPGYTRGCFTIFSTSIWENTLLGTITYPMKIVNYDSMSLKKLPVLVGHVLPLPRAFFLELFPSISKSEGSQIIQVMCWGPCNHGSVMTCPSTSQWVIYHMVLGLGRYEVFFWGRRGQEDPISTEFVLGSSAIFFETKKPGTRWNATRLQIDLANRSCEYNTENIHPKMTFGRCFPLRILYIFKENLDVLCWFVICRNSISRTLLTMSKMVVSKFPNEGLVCAPRA